jgi:hypothetical protein
MLESWIFFIKKTRLVRTIKLFFLITKLQSKGLERNIEDVQKIGHVVSEMRACHL